MKAAPAPSPRGVALVIVLLFLVLMSVLVVALITVTNNESIAAHIYEGSVTAKQLDASAVGLVLGQLADGTHSVKVPGQTTGRLAWASQPGLIRTWDDTGAMWKIFKLYSARDMVVNPDPTGRYSVSKVTEGSRTLEGEVPSTWPAQTAHFTDLNEPAVVPDPSGRIARDGGHFRAVYPIVDPLAGVDGFSITNPPGYGGTRPTYALDPAKPPHEGTSGNPAPMPVRWIYVLRDGTFTVPTGSADGGRTATWIPGEPASPSRENPITGRIAFWTDDETCKLNLNTASEPTPWDTPRAITIQDLNYGRFQPVQKEYQRFPGHPLSVALSPVLFPGASRLDPLTKEELYKVLPRVGTGGTKAATEEMVSIDTTDTAELGKKVARKIVLHDDRLFANVDEFLFRSEMPSSTRVENTVFLTDTLHGLRFFLTANSRAPELTLSGTPRIALWPIPRSETSRTAYDQLAAFCSTIGRGATAYPFYFQRADPTSPVKDYTSIKRNRELYSYLQQTTARAVPGYGGSFLKKWGQDRDQVLTEIFDYIRCVNLHDSQHGATRFAENGQVAPIHIEDPQNAQDTQGFGRFFTISQAGMHFICSQEANSGILTNAGASKDKLEADERLVNVSFLFEPWSPALGFYPIYENLYFDVQFSTDGFLLNGAPLKMRAGGAALVNTIGSGWHNNGREHGGSGGLRGPMQAFGGGNYKWISQATPADIIVPKDKPAIYGVRTTGPTMAFTGGTATIKIYSTNSADPNSLVQKLSIVIPSGNFPVPQLVRTGTAAYRGGGETDASAWWTFGGRYSNLGQVPHAPGEEYADPTRRWAEHDGFPPGFKIGGIFRDEDVVRSVVPNHGDIRLIAGLHTVPESAYVKVRDAEWDSSNRMLHVFTSSAGSHFLYGFANEPGDRPGGRDRANPLGGTLGGIPAAGGEDQLVASGAVKYHYSRLPEIRPGAGKLFNHWNDYDNGVATWSDGSYINKPDEGNFSVSNSSYTYYAWYTSADVVGNFFSPSRLIPSAGMLGSLPTGLKRNRPWETLLFRPEVRLDATTSKPHPGTQTPKDHLIMDLFWMPAIEPYAISEPFSTAGKINLNYEIAPFSYIRRATGLYGVLKGEEPLVLPNSAAQIYKLWDHETNDHPRLPADPLNQNPQVRDDWNKAYNGQPPFDKMRRPIDPVLTLAQADQRFAAGDAFRSATEICELHLVRQGEKIEQYRSGEIWRNALITGDNTRERPYTNLYGKLTTRSNTFTIHVRAQVLRQSGGAHNTEWNKWREDRTEPITEHRGSTLVERYIDAADANLVDFATDPNAVADRAWRVRVVSAKKFVP